MATYFGNSGTVDVDGATVAEVVSFTINETADRVEDTVLTDTSRTYKAGLKDASGTVTCRYDHTDATGQEVMVVGATVTLILQPIGGTAGYKEATVSAVITSVSTETQFNEIQPRTFSWEGAGALVWSTIV